MMIQSLLLALLIASLGQAAQNEEVRHHPDHPRVQLTEDARVQGYSERNYTWPIETFRPNTEGWNKIMRARLGQVEEIEDTVSGRWMLVVVCW